MAVVVLMAGAGLADTPAFDRYQVILSRKPFGAPPPAPEQPRIPVAAEPNFTAGFRLTMIVETEDGNLRVGFVDNQNKSYNMFVGDIKNEIELVSADFTNGEIILKKGERFESLKFGGGGGQPTTAAGNPGAQTPQKQAEAARSSYVERRRARVEQLQREQEMAAKPPEPAYTGEALDKHLSEYKMEVIRQGLPALPIPLTEAEDDQLVAEGFLPAIQ